ncbi:MAG: hypothetical protein ACHP9Z_21680 [Streptosporangiales bacterium]
MPATDEDILRDLMRRCTDGLHPPASVAPAVAARQRRRHLRHRAFSVAATGAALGAAAGVALAAAPRQAGQPGTGGAPAIRLTAAQRTLYKLSATAARQAPGPGRYVVMREIQDNYVKISVIDSVTGDVWTYQHGAGVPAELPVDRHGSPTQAEFKALPTSPAALRALLIAQYDQQQKAGQEAMAAQVAKAVKAAKGALREKLRERLRESLRAVPVPLSDDDKVFEQASDMLWNPLVGPRLRSALLKVLAATPGVMVSTHARDDRGRPAVEISRVESKTGVVLATYEAPATVTVLEQTDTYPPSYSGGHTSVGRDLYLSITRAGAVPPNPYAG